jgi:hypothetical protein
MAIAPPGPVNGGGAGASGSASGYVPLIDGDPPITWPCNAELDVAVHLDQVPAAQRHGLLNDIDISLRQITAGSPYRLTRTSPVTVIPTNDTLASVAANADADLIIAVDDHTRPDATDLLTPGTWGTGGLLYRGAHAYVGWVLIDITALEQLPAGGGPRSRQALIIHEVLHALGLGHTDDTGSVMQPALCSPTGVLSDADIAGLGRLNLIACSQAT